MKKPRKPAHRNPRPNRALSRDDKPQIKFPRQVFTLYEDDALIVIDKPPGLLAVPIKGSHTPSALSVLTEGLESRRQRPFVVHRIDRFASGALLFAKTAGDRHDLVKQFLAHTPVRQYLTVVRGRINNPSGTLVHYFRREGMFQQLRTAKDPKASRAELRYTVERLLPDATIVRVELVTGFQNQIRAQFAALGHPIIGDRKYHREEAREQLINRVTLHAAHLEFIHPRSKATVAIDCKLPADIQHLIRELSHAKPMPPKPMAPKPTSPKHTFRKKH
jgi:23S rRNA pseudouridine1911/1915/1917 synthase